METFKVYLAGAMSDVSFSESNVWRETAKEWLESRECNYHVSCLNPNDYYNFLEKLHDTEKEIQRFDLHKVRKSNLILANLNGNSTGTAMELQHAFDNYIPIIGYKDDNEPLHPWLDYVCDRVFDNLDDTLKYINSYYLSE